MTKEAISPSVLLTPAEQYLSTLQGQIDARVNFAWTALEENSVDRSAFPELENSQIDIKSESDVRAAVTGHALGLALIDLTTSQNPEDANLLEALEGHFSPEMDQISHFLEERQPEVAKTVSRRDLLKGAMAGAAFLGFNSIERASGLPATLVNGSLHLAEETFPSNTPNEEEPSSDKAHPGQEVEHESPNHNYISRINHITAITVTTLFAATLGTQTAAGLAKDGQIPKPLLKTLFGTADQSRAELSGWTSSTMAILWTARLLALKHDSETNSNPYEKNASKNAYDHEFGELSNLGIAAGLVVASEVTSKLFYERREEYINRARGVLKEMFHSRPEGVVGTGKFMLNGAEFTEDDFVEFLKEGENSQELQELSNEETLHKVYEVMDRFIESQKTRKDLEEIEHNLGSMSQEQLSEQIDILKSTLATDITKMGVLSNLLAPLSLTFTTASMANGSLKKIALNTAKMHYLEQLRESKATGAELNEETLSQMWNTANDKTKSEMNGSFGLVNLAVTHAANVSGAALFGDPPNIFFLIKHGAEEWLHNSVEGFAYSSIFSMIAYNTYLAKNGLINISDIPGKDTDAIIKSMQVMANTAYAIARPPRVDEATQITKNLPPFLVGRINLNLATLVDNVPQKIKEVFFGDAISNVVSDWKEKVRSYIFKTNGDEDELADLVGEMMESERESEGQGKDYASPEDRMREVVESSGIEDSAALWEEIQAFVTTQLKKIEAITLEEIQARGVDSITEELLGQLGPVGLSDETVDEMRIMYKKLIQEKIDSLQIPPDAETGASEGAHHHGLSHSARDVRNALGTQLWAVGSLQVVFKKALGLDQEGVMDKNKAKAYTTTILSIIAGTSAVADNVAAMLFGIDVLSKIGEKVQGVKFNDHSVFAQKLRKYAFLMSVFAGSLSKIGNGPNMSIEKLKEVLWHKGDKKMVAETLPNLLATSFANGWSWSVVGMLLARASADLWGEIDRAEVA